MSHLYQRPSNPLYYIEDCRILHPLFCCLLPLFSCLPLWTTVKLPGKKLQNATKKNLDGDHATENCNVLLWHVLWGHKTLHRGPETQVSNDLTYYLVHTYFMHLLDENVAVQWYVKSRYYRLDIPILFHHLSNFSSTCIHKCKRYYAVWNIAFKLVTR